MARSFCAFMLRCSDGSRPLGRTDDLERGLNDHTEGMKGSYNQP
jgi:predicted GIY-YIG superfamily endonuclease